jgi:hypothetical protein
MSYKTRPNWTGNSIEDNSEDMGYIAPRLKCKLCLDDGETNLYLSELLEIIWELEEDDMHGMIARLIGDWGKDYSVFAMGNVDGSIGEYIGTVRCPYCNGV